MRRLGSAAVCAALVATTALATTAPGSASAPDDTFVSAGGQQVDDTEVTRAAEQASTSEDKIEALLADDPAARLDTSARLKFVDTFEPGPAEDDDSPARLSAPLSKTFSLHSRKSSKRTIYLDFTGERVCGTAWDPYECITASRFDTDGRAGFNKSERRAIQRVWRSVVEDYAPFNVDITTQRPPLSDLVRSSRADQRYGVQAVITSSTRVRNQVCGGVGCAGVAYMGVFNSANHNAGRVLWAFPKEVRNNPRRIGDVVSHEAGHTLGLAHDGTARLGYYGGHGIWGPIMGNSARHLTQWSRGQYAGANNKQNDIALIARNGAPRLRDDHADGRKKATFLKPRRTRSGRITSHNDVDMFRLRTKCTSRLVVKVRNAAQSPNLDVWVCCTNG